MRNFKKMNVRYFFYIGGNDSAEILNCSFLEDFFPIRVSLRLFDHISICRGTVLCVLNFGCQFTNTDAPPFGFERLQPDHKVLFPGEGPKQVRARR